ncbi:MAG: thioredoxin [Acidimicrobiales bacterium]
MTPAEATVITCPSCGKKNRVPSSAQGYPRCGSCKAPLPWLVEASDEDFEVVAARGGQLVLVDIWAEWCAPCRLVAPAVERAAREMAGRLKVVKVDADKAPRVTRRFGVQGIPTLVFLRDGKEVDRVVGALPADKLLERVRANTGAGRDVA